MTRTVRSAASYGSQSELPVTFGLGKHRDGAHPPVDVQIVWPDGVTETREGLETGRTHVLEEGR